MTPDNATLLIAQRLLDIFGGALAPPIFLGGFLFRRGFLDMIVWEEYRP